jgi:hypothetical protein
MSEEEIKKAREACGRILATAFKRPGEHMRISIPVDRERDDDVIVSDFFEKLSSFPPDDGAEGWIKVSERLPERNVKVLVRTNNGRVFVGWLANSGVWQSLDQAAEHGAEETHWTPIRDLKEEKP